MEVERKHNAAPASFENFGDLLRYLRKRARLTQRQLGLSVGYSESQINKLERGHRQPNPSVVSPPMLTALNLTDNSPLARRLAELAEQPNRGDGLAARRPGAAQRIRERNGHDRADAAAHVATVARNGAAGPTARTSTASAATNLPAAVNSFIGREREIAGVLHGLSAARLVTLHGPGGAGKTRLALQAAGAVAAAYADGIGLVELAPVANPLGVPQVVANALGIFAKPTQPVEDALTAALRDRHMLIILDNCEQVIDGCADLADRLARACPHVSVLSTSRAPLGIPGERRVPVPPLALPAMPVEAQSAADLLNCESVQLFIERAQAARGPENLQLTPAFVRTVARICVRLDGLPLAIELAAARTSALSVEDILDRLDDRFSLLVAGNRAGVLRQQTLSATIEWSYSLLSEPERMLFERLAVFSGSWTLDAVEAVCAGIRGTGDIGRCGIMLASLVEKSLVNALLREDGEPSRYTMLESIRQFAAEHLANSADAEAVARRHADYYVSQAEALELRLFGPEQLRTLAELERDHDNMRTAFEHLTSRGDGCAALRLVGALRRFWQTRGRVSEGRMWYMRAIELPGACAPEVRAKALFTGAVLAYYQNDIALSKELDRAAVEAAQGSGDFFLKGQIEGGMVYHAESDEDYRRARQRFDAALMSAHRSNSTWLLGNALHKLGTIELDQSHHEEAERFLTASEAHLMDSGDRLFTLVTHLWLGHIALALGRFDRARRSYVAALRLCQQIGADYAEHNSVWYCLGGLAEVAAVARQPLRMARLLGVVEREFHMLGGMPNHWFTAVDASGGVERYRLRTGMLPDRAAFEAAWAEGRAMKLEQAIVYALSDA